MRRLWRLFYDVWLTTSNNPVWQHHNTQLVLRRQHQYSIAALFSIT